MILLVSRPVQCKSKFYHRVYRRVTRGRKGGGGEVFIALFRKLEKKRPNWRKNALIVVIYGYNFSIKMKFLRVSRGKTRRFFPCRAFLSGVVGECLSKCPNSKKTPLQKLLFVLCISALS